MNRRQQYTTHTHTPFIVLRTQMRTHPVSCAASVLSMHKCAAAHRGAVVHADPELQGALGRQRAAPGVELGAAVAGQGDAVGLLAVEAPGRVAVPPARRTARAGWSSAVRGVSAECCARSVAPWPGYWPCLAGAATVDGACALVHGWCKLLAKQPAITNATPPGKPISAIAPHPGPCCLRPVAHLAMPQEPESLQPCMKPPK